MLFSFLFLICEETAAYTRGWVTGSITGKWTSWDEEYVFLPSNPCWSSPSGELWLLQKIMLVETCVFRACMGLGPGCLTGTILLCRDCAFGQGAYNGRRRRWSLDVQAGVFPACMWGHAQCRMALELGNTGGPKACSPHAAMFQQATPTPCAEKETSSLIAISRGLGWLEGLGRSVLLLN